MPEADRHQPALIGGLIAGLLSVLPVAQAGNACCCLWAWVGGAVAAKMYIDRAPQRVTWEDALKVAAVAGLLAAIIRVFLGTPMDLAFMPAQLNFMEEFAGKMAEPQRQRLLEVLGELRGLSSGQLLLRYLLPISLFWAAVLFVITLLGSLLGVALFEKRKEPQTDFGGNSDQNSDT